MRVVGGCFGSCAPLYPRSRLAVASLAVRNAVPAGNRAVPSQAPRPLSAALSCPGLLREEKRAKRLLERKQRRVTRLCPQRIAALCEAVSVGSRRGTRTSAVLSTCGLLARPCNRQTGFLGG